MIDLARPLDVIAEAVSVASVGCGRCVDGARLRRAMRAGIARLLAGQDHLNKINQFLASHYEAVVSINLSQRLSGTLQAARPAVSRMELRGRLPPSRKVIAEAFARRLPRLIELHRCELRSAFDVHGGPGTLVVACQGADGNAAA
jgi:hypothetical protein